MDLRNSAIDARRTLKTDQENVALLRELWNKNADILRGPNKETSLISKEDLSRAGASLDPLDNTESWLEV